MQSEVKMRRGKNRGDGRKWRQRGETGGTEEHEGRQEWDRREDSGERGGVKKRR